MLLYIPTFFIQFMSSALAASSISDGGFGAKTKKQLYAFKIDLLLRLIS